MKLSIVIPVYNGASSIEKLVDAIYDNLNQYDIEIILLCQNDIEII